MAHTVLVYGSWGLAAALVVAGSFAVDRGRQTLAGYLGVLGLAVLILGFFLTGAM